VQAILAAATEVFLERGYANTSVDDIVKRAAGSKATVYKHFNNKRELFTAVVKSVVVRHSQEELDSEEPDPEKALRLFAQNRFKIVLSRHSIALLRLVISEAENFPEVAQTYYGHGPGHSQQMLSAFLRIHQQRGTLAIDDPDEAAFHFMSLLMHPWYLKRLQWLDKPPSELDVERSVQSTLKAFMKLYAP
jgi:AcrR family transcriptional regulator